MYCRLSVLLFYTMPSILSIASAALVCLSAATASPHKQPAQNQVDPFFYKGFDLSSLHILELGNVTYKDTARRNATRPAEDILGDGGMNTVRLRYGVSVSDMAKTEADILLSESGSTLSLDNTISHTHWAKPSVSLRRATVFTLISISRTPG